MNNNQEEKLREIVYRNWKNGDEVGLFEEVKELFLKDKFETFSKGNTPDGMEKKLHFDPEKARFESQLAVFINFVEDEANRIDEERRGARRRDGGRTMMCASFLKQFLPPIQALSKAEGEKSYRQFILNILDGIDQADKEMGNNGGGTKAIRLAIESRNKYGILKP